MLPLPPNPPHVRVPSDNELRFGATYAALSVHWREEECETCLGQKSFRMWSGIPLSSEVVEYECDCVEQMMLDRWLGVRGLGKNLRRRGFNDMAWVDKDTRAALAPWTQSTAEMVRYLPGLMLTGPTSSGKSLVSSLIQREVLRAGIEAMHIPLTVFTSLVDDWRSEEVRKWYRKVIRSIPTLFITKMGKDHLSMNEWGLARLTDLFEYRLDNQLLTVIELSSTVDELVKVMPFLRPCAALFDHVQVKSSTPYPALQIQAEEMRLGIGRPVVMR